VDGALREREEGLGKKRVNEGHRRKVDAPVVPIPVLDGTGRLDESVAAGVAATGRGVRLSPNRDERLSGGGGSSLGSDAKSGDGGLEGGVDGSHDCCRRFEDVCESRELLGDREAANERRSVLTCLFPLRGAAVGLHSTTPLSRRTVLTPSNDDDGNAGEVGGRQERKRWCLEAKTGRTDEN
jgi:hypothetical protein